MKSGMFPENTTGKNSPAQVAKAAVLLVISLGLYLFSIDFPAFVIFEPQSTGWSLWVSYANDLILPFAFYFFICLAGRWLKSWQSRASLALAIPVLLEIGQGLYYQFSPTHYVGSFDPLDIVMYAISVGLAVLLEQRVFAKLLRFW
jgi:hypothetical protein